VTKNTFKALLLALLVAGCGDSEQEIAQERLLHKALNQFSDVTVMSHTIVHIDGGGELEAKVTCSFIVDTFKTAKFKPVDRIQIYHNEPLGKATCDIAKVM
jgi:hypothetical protein